MIAKQIFNSKIDDDAWWKPRRFDITEFIKQGKKNLFVVKVQDTFGLGGIQSAILYQEPINLLVQGDFSKKIERWQILSGDEKYRVDEYLKKNRKDLEITVDNGMYVDEHSIRIKKKSRDPLILLTDIAGLKSGKYRFNVRWKQCFRETTELQNKAISIHISSFNSAKQALKEPEDCLLAIRYPSSESDKWQEDFSEFCVPDSLSGKKLCLCIFIYEPATYYLDEVSIKKFN